MLRSGVYLLFGLSLIASAHAHESNGDSSLHQHYHIPIALEQTRVEVYERDGYFHIDSNAIPDHATGQFPNRGNPNSIQPQDFEFKVTTRPHYIGHPIEAPGMLFGVAVNGVPFEPGTGEFWQNDRSSGWRYEALSGKLDLGLDNNNAHVQPDGTYHYHGIPWGLVDKDMSFVGYAADGFPVFVSTSGRYSASYRIKSGYRDGGPGGQYDGTFVADYEFVPGLGNLDQCNGIFDIVPGSNSGQKEYFYVLTETFPFIPRCHMGRPDDSFRKQMAGGGGPPGMRGGGGRGYGGPQQGGGYGGGYGGSYRERPPPQY